MRRPDPKAQAVLSAFAAEGARERLHTAVRWWTCPFPQIAGLLPQRGRVLDLGCGHGHFSMYLALRSPELDVLGVDIDADKTEAGSAAILRAGLAGRVTLRRVDDEWLPDPGSFDAVVTNDVLYLLGRARARSALAAMAAALRPDGTVVVKEMAATPRWKYAVNQAQEHLATGVLGLTQGTGVQVLPEEEIAAPLRDAGLTVTRIALDRGYPHPHAAFVGRRPPVSVS